MRRSTERILTTHVGSLPRPADLLAMVEARQQGKPVDEQAHAFRLRAAVNEIVRKQIELGIDVVDDGELGKPSFVSYVNERLAGFEIDGQAPRQSPWAGSREAKSFPEFYAQTLAADPALRREMGDRAERLARATFGEARLIDTIEALLLKVARR